MEKKSIQKNVYINFKGRVLDAALIKLKKNPTRFP